ncbi:hypothetical protein ASG22_01045 [Chryseobacterium sp. Leaf405]|uniref:hypothetical protein n=1 Tax=Chryseobacterium sp. Leaf405 TaxID=1736367 RepID=UPI0006F593F1|nr:hypothetical protein [Chryseobacterium sp. Leaf405]KQT35640.1 hypothetical protein ASG22_01045 [Chryseobacterium sp. Leaf405]
MKYFNIILFVFIGFSAQAQYALIKLWETNPIAFPESVISTTDILYVSLLDHYPLREKGKGKIAKIGLDGKIIDANWITGLDTPEGMGIWKGKLYVADINRILVIDIQKGKLDHSISVSGSSSLNDLVIDHEGFIYTSDIDLGIVYRIINEESSVYIKDLPGVNGLQIVGNHLYMVTDTDIFKLDTDKKLTSLAKFHSGADGLASLGNDSFLATVYNGHIYHLDKNGKMELILNTEAQKIGSADLIFDSKKRIVYVPTLYGNSIIAYQLK